MILVVTHNQGNDLDKDLSPKPTPRWSKTYAFPIELVEVFFSQRDRPLAKHDTEATKYYHTQHR